MTEKYEPDYAKGQIIVSFKNSCDFDFAKTFGEGLGYIFMGKEPFPGFYLFDVGEENESSAMKEFESYNKFVAGVEKMDKRLERRFDFSDNLEKKVRALSDYSETANFKEYLEELRKEIDSFED